MTIHLFLDRKTNGLGPRGKPAIAEGLANATFAFWLERLGGRAL
jgi:hypothetical protein